MREPSQLPLDQKTSPEMPGSEGRERRRYPRYRISEEVMVALLIPDQTFTPFALRGTAMDVSIGGIRIKTYQLTKRDYLALVQSMCHVKVSMELSEVGERIELRGQVVWSDYHEALPAENAHCYLGISFYRFTEQAEKEFLQLFDRLEHSRASNELPKELRGIQLKKL